MKEKKKKTIKTIKLDDVKKIIQTKVETVNREEEGRTITASQLPISLHISRMMKYVTNLNDVKLCIIAIKKLDKAWEAFVSYPDIRDLKANYKDEAYWETYEWCCENIRNVEQVRMMGEKLSKDHASILFPDWAILSYFE